MRIHGLLTVLALLIIAAGFVPQYMGDIGTFTGEHTGVMLADELGTIGDDFDLFFKDGLMTDTLVLEYFDGTEYVTVADEVAQQFYSYYLLNNDDSQKLYLDGSFDDGVFTDLSGNGNHGVPYNGATTGTGVVGDGMSFDGVDDYLNCGNDDSINLIDAISISFFIYYDGTSYDPYFISHYSYRNGWNLQRRHLYTNKLHGIFSASGTTVVGDVYTTSDLSVDDWSYITLTAVKNGALLLYKDGVLVGNNVVGEWTNPLSSLKIGGYAAAYEFYKGNLDEIRIYDRAISPEEVEVLNDVPLQMQSWNGYTLYASYEYMDTFSPIATDLFTIGFPVLGIVILVFVGASYLYSN